MDIDLTIDASNTNEGLSTSYLFSKLWACTFYLLISKSDLYRALSLKENVGTGCIYILTRQHLFVLFCIIVVLPVKFDKAPT